MPRRRKLWIHRRSASPNGMYGIEAADHVAGGEEAQVPGRGGVVAVLRARRSASARALAASVRRTKSSRMPHERRRRPGARSSAPSGRSSCRSRARARSGCGARTSSRNPWSSTQRSMPRSASNELRRRSSTRLVARLVASIGSDATSDSPRSFRVPRLVRALLLEERGLGVDDLAHQRAALGAVDDVGFEDRQPAGEAVQQRVTFGARPAPRARAPAVRASRRAWPGRR